MSSTGSVGAGPSIAPSRTKTRSPSVASPRAGSKARELEEHVGTLADEAARIERDLAALSQTSAPALAEQWGALVDRALALDEDARLQVRQLVTDTFERLVIYVRGMEPSYSPDIRKMRSGPKARFPLGIDSVS